MRDSLKNFFYPKSIIIAGVSSKKGSIGYELTSSILKYGFKGSLFLVNPSAEEILGIKCYNSVTSVPVKVDLAIILVPKQFTPGVIDECILKNIKSLILITAGFRETGKEGEKAEELIIEKIRKTGARLVGPNCMGVINTIDEIKLNATFVAEYPETGKSAFLSQSGALGAAVLNSLRQTGIRFAHFISVGNKADVSENDVIEFWFSDDNIKVITLYLESFSNGQRFIEIINRQENRKPIIILKAGKTSAGMKAASSHTGALASSDRSVDAVISQYGLIRVDNLNDLFNTAKGFENFPCPEGSRIAVVTNAGGPAILAVDELEKCGLKLAVLSEATKNNLRSVVHPEGSINNPVDLLPGGTAENYKVVVELLLKDSDVDSVVVIFVEPVMVKPLCVVESINSIKSGKPVFTVVMPLPEFWKEYKDKYPDGKPLFRNPEDPAVVLKNMLRHYNYKTGVQRLLPETKKENIIKTSTGFITQAEVHKIAALYSLPVIQNREVSFEELKSINSGFPYVLKGAGEKIIHKTELGAVELNLNTSKELLYAAERMIKRFNKSGNELENFILQPFIKQKYELLIGGFTDPDFGPMVMFGTGGKYVEYYEDVAVKSGFLSEADADDIIDSTVIGKLLKGVRGETPADVCGIKNTILSVAQLMLDYNSIGEIDINPLIVSEDNKLYAVDIRIKLK